MLSPCAKLVHHGCKSMTLFAVPKWILPERNKPLNSTTIINNNNNNNANVIDKKPVSTESFLRSIKRRSLRVKRSKSLVIQEKRKSDSFVNSQEWTLSRCVPDLRLGIVGSLSSGKSALVHRYLTGSYMQEESPEGGRFKKEILVDGQSYLLLIRDEGGPPELQFTAWVDAVIFVFSLENEASFNAIYNYFTKMAHFRNSADIPLILVGTQDAISENNPRVIDDSRARKLAADLKRCSYYETCATYGLNVERVFQDACQKIVQQRLSASSSCCLTPTNSRPATPCSQQQQRCCSSSSTNGFATSAPGAISPMHTHQTIMGHHKDLPASCQTSGRSMIPGGCSTNGTSSGGRIQQAQQQSLQQLPLQDNKEESLRMMAPAAGVGAAAAWGSNSQLATSTENNNKDGSAGLQPPSKDKDLPTPSSTPTTSRKSRRRSNLFTPSKKGDDKLKNGELGSGRAIPVKQGYLYKRSSKALNKEWKKKYVTLCDDGRLTYHPSLHDYMDDVHGKEISLQYVTVKVPGQKPRGSKSIMASAGSNNGLHETLGSLTITSFQNKEKRLTDKVLLTAFELHKDTASRALMNMPNASDDSLIINTNNSGAPMIMYNGSNAAMDKAETPNVKKRHRRMKSSGVKNTEADDSDGYEFFIVSLDNKQWHFEAGNSEERDEWVAAIEQQILNSLQGNESAKTKSRITNCADPVSVQAVKSRVPGNSYCVDCDAKDPDWASLNLGVLMCIECSGIHRNLGSHISRVRSLNLDDWPPGHIAVMLSMGNQLANSVWEARIGANSSSCSSIAKPGPSSSREDKECWIRMKYEAKEFLAPISRSTPLGQQLADAVRRGDMKQLALVLAHAGSEHVNATLGPPRDFRTPLHLACAMGNLSIAQLLIWHNANVKSVDHDGRTCLAYARVAANLALNKVNTSGHNSNNSSVSANCDLSPTATASLVELLIANGCPEVSSSNSTTATSPSNTSNNCSNNSSGQMASSVTSSSGGTLPRRRLPPSSSSTTSTTSFDKLPSSVI